MMNKGNTPLNNINESKNNTSSNFFNEIIDISKITNDNFTITKDMLEDNKDVKFEDLFSINDIQKLQDEFSDATGVVSIITRLDGTPITKPSNFCRLCNDIIRKTKKGCENCYKSDAALGEFNNKGPTVKICKSGGLWDAGASISIDNTHIANWLIGQVRDESQSIDKIMDYAREIGADEKEAAKALNEVTYMSRDRFNKISQVLYTLANQLSDIAYKNIQSKRYIKQIKETEQKLLIQKWRLNNILEGTDLGTWEWNIQTGELIINERWASMIGYTSDELNPMTFDKWSLLCSPEDKRNVETKLEQCYKREREFYESEFKLKHKDGSWVWILGRGKIATWTEDGKPSMMFGTHIDITEKKRTSEMLQNIQKMDSLGVLAGGIAHDFNNLLCGIYGYIDLALHTSHDDKVIKYLTKSMDTIGRTKNLTQQLLTFSKGGAPIKKLGFINEFLKETVLFALSGSSCISNFLINDNLWSCNFDKNQIGQVIDNIVINAKQAMDQEGIITISAINRNIQNGEHHILNNGKYIQISIGDTGCGINEDDIKNIFDPFFTTKSSGHGLGLATSYSIVNRHGGIIEVESIIDKGTTVHLILPASANNEIEENSENDFNIETDSSKGNKGKIIIMDDEEMIRETLSSMVELLGYVPILTSNGYELLQTFSNLKDKNEPIAGMIFDLTIPGSMGGIKTIESVRLIDKSVPVFVASGYSEDPIMSNPNEYGFTASIEKPFKLTDVGELLKTYLE